MGCSSSRTAPAWVLFHWVQSFRTFSCMPSPQAAVPARKSALAWAPLYQLYFLPKACSCVGSPWATASLGAYTPALAWGPPQAAAGQPASPWSSPWSEGASLLWCLEHHSHPFIIDLGDCRAVSLTCHIPLSYNSYTAFFTLP